VGAAVGLVLQFGKKFLIVPFVGARFPGISGRENPGSTPERIDAEPRIVGERRQSRRKTRVPRLGERVLAERIVGLLRLDDSELGLRHHPGAERRKELLDFGFLSRIS
jgi:hypothetical protein